MAPKAPAKKVNGCLAVFAVVFGVIFLLALISAIVSGTVGAPPSHQAESPA